jgi:hypothetical protein
MAGANVADFAFKAPRQKGFIESSTLLTRLKLISHFLVPIPNLQISPNQCSRLKPSYEFHFEGLVRIQDVIPRVIEMKYKTHIKLVYELYGTCFQYNVKK